ncbi:MAG: hypothetical protein ACOX6Q_02525 [Candidatus Dojkabacteria bacterium]|jgi:hypothetical protein
MKRLKAALGYIVPLLSFVFLFTFVNVHRGLAQVNTDVTFGIHEVTEYTDSLKNEKNILFVEDDCESCTELKDDMKGLDSTNFLLYVVNLSDTTEKEKYSDLFNYIYGTCKNKEDISEGVPFLYSDETCFVGKLAVFSQLTVLNIPEEGILYKDGVDYLQSYMNRLTFDEMKNKSIAELVTDSTKVWEFVLLGVLFVVGIVFLVYWLVNRKKTNFKSSKVFIVLQVSLFLLPTAYLGIKVNTAQNLSRKYSSAGDCIAEGNCKSYAERAQALLDRGGVSESRAEELQKYITSVGGVEQANADVVYASGQILKQTRKTLEDKAKQDAQEYNRTIGGNVVATPVTAEQVWDAARIEMEKLVKKDAKGNAQYEEIVWKQNSDGTFTYTVGNEETTLNLSTIAAISPKAVYNARVNEMLLKDPYTYNENDKTISITSCDSYEECTELLLKKNNKTRDDYQKDPTGNSGKYFYQYDSQTGQMIATPLGLSTVDDFCSPSMKLAGSSVTMDTVCYCKSPFGDEQYVATPAASGADCDAVCRVRNLDCDTCSPDPEDPPTPPPPSSGPYCGDGILGNTTGEECEKGDPAGVSCSWATCSYCKCPTIEEPFCGDGIINAAGEECEVGDPSGTSCKWDTCNKVNCKCMTPGCGDGVLDAGEQCERDNPEGVTCTWDKCNQLKCECIKPGCGDGKLDAGEQCEKNNPTGATCLWEECDKSECTCDVKVSEYCGDGKLQNGEQCELGNPSGTTCTWDKCSKATCMCPSQPYTPPQTSIFDNSYIRNIVLGATMLLLGLFFYPTTKFIDSLYITIGQGVIKLGRYVTNNGEIRRTKKKKSIEDKFK